VAVVEMEGMAGSQVAAHPIAPSSCPKRILV
jgi:hypothetical protein